MSLLLSILQTLLTSRPTAALAILTHCTQSTIQTLSNELKTFTIIWQKLP